MLLKTHNRDEMIQPFQQGEVMKHQPWWRRPLIGETSAWEKLKEIFFKPDVPHEQILEHDTAMQEAEKLANVIAKFDSEKFDDPEFILLVRTKHYLEREVPGYEGLEYSAQLLEAALQARNSFLGIEEIEFQYRGSLQQQFYNIAILKPIRYTEKERQ